MAGMARSLARRAAQPRRIAVLSIHTSPLDQPGTGDAGGMNVYVVETALRLAQAGVEVEVFTRATSSATPTSVELAPGVTVRHVTAGNHFTCALHADKTVACWGSGDHNSLGQGDTISWFSPKGVEALADVEELRAGLGNTACARKTSGELWCWGCALEGGYCSQAVGDFQAVKKVEGLGLVHTFGLGVAHACAVVTSSGITELRCWGDNGQGVLGNGSLGGASAVPVSVVGSSTSSWTSVTGSDLSSLAIADGGVAYSWGGMQPNGAAGESQTLPIARPLVANPNDGETITRFAGGWRHACAAVTTPAGDRVRCWGSNDEGALGAPVGSTAKPVDVTDGQAPLALTGVVAGWYHACAITSGGSGVKCWGNNNLGQLGDGTTSASSVPVDVSFP